MTLFTNLLIERPSYIDSGSLVWLSIVLKIHQYIVWHWY